jgi:hypothetical protein
LLSRHQHAVQCLDKRRPHRHPITAEGQIHGGVVDGISNALFEWMAYDAEAQPLTVTFANYPLPTAAYRTGPDFPGAGF